MSLSRRIRAVAFDIDNVLMPIRFPSILPKALGISASAANDFFAGPFEDCLLGKGDVRERIRPYLALWGWQGTVEEFQAFWFRVDSDAFPPGLRLAERLRAAGVLCVLASTQEEHRARHLEKLLGVPHRFEVAFFSCRLQCRKPDPEFFLTVSRTIKMAPEEILLIDDDARNVAGAQAVGWNAVQFQIGDDLDEALAPLGLGQ